MIRAGEAIRASATMTPVAATPSILETPLQSTSTCRAGSNASSSAIAIASTPFALQNPAR
jgi:hypothetical protein